VRIAFIGLRAIGPSAAGGIEKAIEELGTRLVRLGHEVTVFTRSRYDNHEGSDFKGVKLRRLPAIYTKHLEAISNTVVAVCCALRGFDIVHINATGPALLSFLPRLFGRKVVVTVHGLDWKREKWGAFAKIWLRLGAWAAVCFPHRTVVVSRTLTRYYRDEFRREVIYIPNGVTLPDPSSLQSLENPLGLPKGGYVLFLSRLVPEKGCHTLIAAFRKLVTDLKLVIVGPPTHSEEYAERLRRLADGDPRIVFAGPKFGPQKDALFRDAYLFVLPSTVEGMAIVLLEAMSFGAGCLCSDIPENEEVIETATGEPVAARFKTDDVDDLARQLHDLLSHPELVSRLGKRARDHVAKSFNWDAIARQYDDVYRRISP
jgi:glycosyltransferase involved in cell wall biosynthesis